MISRILKRIIIASILILFAGELGGKMLRILVTGMSGTGKSTALEKLGERGHRVVDTDSDVWSRWVHFPDGSTDWVWREEAIIELLTNHQEGKLFVAGCKSNQGKFYPFFDHVVLLSAPADVILARIAGRENNNYGKNPEERERILYHLAEVEPLLRATATTEVDASRPLDEVVLQLELLD
ncbi:AAA family ATPase [Paenibacillus sp. PL91]|uniref:AAA family ATPase n=1 Tax=Paenibacillus sp. PL91 TaxID=2729538 RepID=UPI001CB8D3DD|nr:AAA family ATPase [Paenibacillus sp. PL91]